MRRLGLTFLALLALANCRDESVAGYGAEGPDWRVVEIDGAAFTARATLVFDGKGGIAGEAPCSGFSGKQTAPYPWFSAEDVIVTRRACPDLKQETAYFSALSEMTLSEVAGDTLILSNTAGREMVFKIAQ